ncbi:alpha,alpha-phosphotrehalase [Oceanobacillus caeni]|uniref:alpha,alpha-phosphotrehalase n=1 Tax=Bacillaceae TaxID=186817 RepID=UPI000621A91F|nr:MULTISPECIES: alpha,alpha-phosphotrehalase [Bacillaceae]KKE78256.1 trehalose-6-phosphate hydrolase [Bacilli bacterium VT-13-104]PZD83107.1 alpha,alpha-phosphotrehalase [Bacilli bacterium]MBU8792324.1 alpha,alpha-phosphotrehalase [Oceanobacillus caeni]MCR1835680.1 alpha,alpha-phosphotrehalase [Oceanobacillus caeni]MED4473634.1 alpha,alpha-phosphotrehalase [Oceanobacillus caeni]
MNETWWKKAVVYQIYPKSFRDTTGSGTGDIQGIIEKLDYLHHLGVDVLWLTPIYKSPHNDNGYDISDYYSIDPTYGTMEDFEELLTETHKRGMKLIMDLVINHTSTEHEWFKQAISSKDNEYRDYYIWKDPVDGKVPNNWESKFGGPAWQYDEKSGQYYLHLFDVTQADLNWENENVRKQLVEMIQFWAEKGIDGFRLDVINLISKDQDFPNDYSGDGRRFYTDGPRVHEYLHEVNQAVFSPYDMMTVGEMSSTTLENCVLYTNPERKELDMTFQFHHLKVDYPGGDKWTNAPFDFIELKQILSKWQVGMHEGGGWNALFWCNHDQPRAVSRFGDDEKYHNESAKMLATTLHMMQGTPYIYQGEEFGMTNPNFTSIEEYRDVESLNAYKTLKEEGKSEKEILAILKQKSRDNGRTPMQWSDEKHAGFSQGNPWINVAENYQDINADKALKDKDSIFYHYQKLIDLRKKYDIITYGDYQLMMEDHPEVFAYTRNWKNEKLVVLSNFYGNEIEIDVPLKDDAGVLISNYSDVKRNILRPYESVVFYMK